MTKLKIMLAAIAGALVISANAATVTAQQMCGERGAVIRSLADKFNERPVSMGLANNGAILEVFSSTKGSWTILITQPSGTSCLVAAGDYWENMPVLASGPKV